MTNDKDRMRETFEAELRRLWADRTDPYLRLCNDCPNIDNKTYQDADTELAWVMYKKMEIPNVGDTFTLPRQYKRRTFWQWLTRQPKELQVYVVTEKTQAMTKLEPTTTAPTGEHKQEG